MQWCPLDTFFSDFAEYFYVFFASGKIFQDSDARRHIIPFCQLSASSWPFHQKDQRSNAYHWLNIGFLLQFSILIQFEFAKFEVVKCIFFDFDFDKKPTMKLHFLKSRDMHFCFIKSSVLVLTCLTDRVPRWFLLTYTSLCAQCTKTEHIFNNFQIAHFATECILKV